MIRDLKNNKRTGLFLLLLACMVIVSCRKNEEGGTSTIYGLVKHHEKIIPGATVYIKFSANDFPGSDSSKYNTSVKADLQGNYSFKCYMGDYYLYATGVDDRNPPLYVSGGVPVKIHRKEQLNVNIAVTE